jgi:hypothetical protein
MHPRRYFFKAMKYSYCIVDYFHRSIRKGSCADGTPYLFKSEAVDAHPIGIFFAHDAQTHLRDSFGHDVCGRVGKTDAHGRNGVLS